MTILASTLAIYQWRHGARWDTDEEVKAGLDPRTRYRVIVARAVVPAPFVFFGMMTALLSAYGYGDNRHSPIRWIFAATLVLSFAILLTASVLIQTLKSRAWSRRLVPPKLRTKWVKLSD